MMRAAVLIMAMLAVAGCQHKDASGSDDLDSASLDSAPSGSLGSDTLAALHATSDSAVQSSSLDDPSGSSASLDDAPVAQAPAVTRSAPAAASAAPRATQSAAPAASAVSVAHATPTGFGDQDLSVDLAGYARKVTNAPGEHVFPRTDTGIDIVTACTSYRGPDLAQTAFIKAGGPQQDPLGLDPDGDGYACGWDPAPFR